jgi:hypothetical protein
MWYRAVRAFVITSMVLNAALAIGLVTAMASGLRPPSVLDFAAGVALLFGFLNAVGDLIEAERPVITGDDAQGGEPDGPVLHIIRHRSEIGDANRTDRETIRIEGLDAFRSER